MLDRSRSAHMGDGLCTARAEESTQPSQKKDTTTYQQERGGRKRYACVMLSCVASEWFVCTRFEHHFRSACLWVLFGERSCRTMLYLRGMGSKTGSDATSIRYCSQVRGHAYGFGETQSRCMKSTWAWSSEIY